MGKNKSMMRLLGMIGFLLCIAAFSAAVWVYSFTHSLTQLEQRGQSDLTLATDSLTSELASYRQLAVSMADDPRMTVEDTPVAELAVTLGRLADLSGALDMVILDRSSGYVASATGAKVGDWAGMDFVGRAFQGTVARELLVSQTYGRRVFLYAVPVFRGEQSVQRVLVILIDLERIEADFRGGRPAVLMSDAAGRIFFSNRSELILRPRPEFLAGGVSPLAKQTPFTVLADRMAGVELWTISGERYLPLNAIHIERQVPVVGMLAEGLIDAGPAFRTAGLQAAVAGIASLLFGAVIVFVTSQRRTLAKANEALERRVAERTSELSSTNAALRSEVAERIEAEEALKRAQNALIQSEKLSALGKMSAGISHELNQPLMAIQSFSENAETFLKRGNTEAAASNLGRVADLAHRMGRIIKNLRAFARQGGETVTTVDLVQAVRAALDLVEARLMQQGTELELILPDTPVWVQGGEVRLQQVALNLITNAADAMEGSANRQLEVEVVPGSPVCLFVRDTGPGLDEPDKVFEPFYSTKSIGEAEGVGLGLSISYGLVQSFGGRITGANRPGGGAEFRVELNAHLEEAAE
jgi:two-component system C4-dicarboxylate transport sensor histidine kinase DctB